VTLTGTVRSVAQRDEAERAVRGIAGVAYVVNQLMVDGHAIDAAHDVTAQAG
jgi:osmotically-inducible protein OsmY